MQERAEPGQRVLADEPVLVEHPRRPLHLGDAGGEVVVPEQDHLLLDGPAAVDHGVQPPGPQLVGIGAVGGAGADGDERFFEVVGVGRPLKEQVKRGGQAARHGLVQLGGAGAEGGPAVQVAGRFEVPGVLGGRLPRLPRLDRVDRVEQRRGGWGHVHSSLKKATGERRP